MQRKEIIEIYMKMIPQYFKCNCKEVRFPKIKLAEQNLNSFRRPVPNLAELNSYLEGKLDDYLKLKIPYNRLLIEIIEMDLLIKWLEIKEYKLDYRPILNFLNEAETRTNENSNVGYNFIINFGEESNRENFFDIKEYKSLDLIGENLFTYIELDKNYNFIEYGGTKWNSLKNGSVQDFFPNFLKPLKSLFLRESKILGITKTKRGDVLIYGKDGILASKRKGHWKIYETSQIKNSFVDIISNTGMGGKGYWIAYNLYQLAIDLSYKRHGALIIFSKSDKKHLKNIISNEESILELSKIGQINHMLKDSIENIELGTADIENDSFSILTELASIDGAITISNDGKIYSFSSIIKSHDKVNKVGARSTAALSSIYHEQDIVALKVSSDGEIELLFKKCEEILSLKFL